jgi:hypothetical protein
VVGSGPQLVQHCIIVVLDTDIAAPEGAFGITMPMTAGIGKQSIDFGTIEVWLTDPTLVERRQHEGRVHCSFTMPDPHRPLPPPRRLTLNLSCMASSVRPTE